MLSEEIFDESRTSLTKAQLERLKERFTNNIKIIYDLCDFIAKSFIQDPNSVSISLIKMCLRSLYAFLTWAPASFIFLSDFLDKIIVGLLADSRLTVQCLQCLTESFSINLTGYEEQEVALIRRKIMDTLGPLFSKLKTIFPLNRNFRQERNLKVGNHNQLTLMDNISKEIAVMFVSLFKNHFGWLFEAAISLFKSESGDFLQLCALMECPVAYMVNLSDVDNDALYRICAEFWLIFTTKLSSQFKNVEKKTKSNVPGALNVESIAYEVKQITGKIFEGELFKTLFNTIIRKMPRPQEVLIESDENGVPKKVTVENTENANLFSMIQTTLRNLLLVNWDSMSMILLNMINNQSHPENFNSELINKISWGVGALNGTLDEELEKQCLTLILRVA